MSESQGIFTPSVPPPLPPAPRRSWIPVIAGALAFVAGLAMLVAVRGVEERELAASPWGDALIILQEEPPEGEHFALWGRRLSAEEVPPPGPARRQMLDEFRKTADGRELIASMGLERNEWVLLLDLPAERWGSLLQSGRAPVPGKAEAVRGALTRHDGFTVDGQAFEVVGRLRDDIPGMSFAYVLPDHPLLRARLEREKELEAGWLLPEGQSDPELRKLLASPGEAKVLDPRALTRRSWAVATILALALMAFGGAALQVRLLGWLARRRPRFLGSALEEIERRPVLLWLTHVGYYGLFLGAMVVATAFPLVNLRLMNMIHGQLYEGDLGFIGQAYLSGNILKAAAMTFAWNYGAATVGMVMIPALLPVLGTIWGLFKTALSFGMVGFGMSPLWTGTAEGYTYHSITMTLELEAYIIAAFLIVAYAIRMLGGIVALFEGRAEVGSAGLARAFAIMGGGTLLVGIMLAIAALYEATSLILLRIPG
jgi:hypothetical protein